MRSFAIAAALFAAFCCQLVLPSSLRADPITITSGTVAAQTWDEMGAHFNAPIQFWILTTHAGLATQFYAPGATAELANHIQLSDVELMGAFNGPGAIDFRFTTGRTVQLPPGPVPVNPNYPYYLTYTAPFTFAGEVVGYGAGGAIVFSHSLRGVGDATFLFHGVAPQAADREGYFLTDTRFTFTPAKPVPEPATVLTLGGTLALLAARRRRRAQDAIRDRVV
jgi:hypothetical protein